MSKTLKEQNAKLIWIFFSFNVLLFYAMAFTSIINFEKYNLQEFIAGRGIWILITPLILFIINGLVSSNQKAIITFWIIKDPLPACRAFSYYAKKDVRVDFNKLESIYSPLPETGQEQNSLWYKIYKSFQENPVVKKSHKDFLLGRDLTSMALLFLIIGGLFGIILITDSTKWWYLIFVLVQYFILAIVAQNHGKRFVCNVLALETSR